MLRAGVEEIAVVLDGDDDAELFTVLGAGPQVVGHPFLDLLALRVASGRLPVLDGRLRAGEDADDRRAETSGDLDPFLCQPHALGTHRLVGDGEVVAHAGAADDDAAIVRVTLHPVQITIGWCFWIAGEEIAGEVHSLDVMLRAEIAHAEKINAFAGVLHVFVEQFEEGIGVERRLEQGAAAALDRGLRVRRGGGSARAQRREADEVAAGDGGCGWVHGVAFMVGTLLAGRRVPLPRCGKCHPESR